MPQTAIHHASTDLLLKPAPINPAWILDGTPVARNLELSRSADGTASTLVWDCTEGSFNWFYDIDETIHIVEGSVVISGDGLKPTRFGPGDVVFFPKGAKAHWRVEGYVRKVAFCRRVHPEVVNLAIRALSRLKQMVTRSAPTASPLAGFGIAG